MSPRSLDTQIFQVFRATSQAGTLDNGHDPQVHQQSKTQVEQAERKLYTVFVSSTFEDMKDIRATVLGEAIFHEELYGLQQ